MSRKISFENRYGQKDVLVVKEEGSPHQADFCLDCGCPKDVCCKRLGAREELGKVLEECLGNETKYGKTVSYIQKRLRELEELEK